MLRATTITELSRKGFHPEEIITLSGHSSMRKWLAIMTALMKKETLLEGFQ